MLTDTSILILTNLAKSSNCFIFVGAQSGQYLAPTKLMCWGALLSSATLQTRSSTQVLPTEYLAVPVLLNLRTSFRLPLTPDVMDGPIAWLPCGVSLSLPASLPALPEGETACVIALYERGAAEEARGELQCGLPLTPAWLRSVWQRGEWDDAIAVGPVLTLNEAQTAGQFMFAIASGYDDAHQLARTLLPVAIDVAERVARRFRAEVQVLALAGDEGSGANVGSLSESELGSWSDGYSQTALPTPSSAASGLAANIILKHL